MSNVMSSNKKSNQINQNPQLSNTALKVQWALCFTFSYVQPVTQCYTQKTVEEEPLKQSIHHKNMIRASPTINYCFKSAAAITLRFQLFSAHNTALQMKNRIRITSAINPVTTENRQLFTNVQVIPNQCCQGARMEL